MILAPMQGLTELLFRRTYEACFPSAIDSAVAPFISLTHGPLNNPTKLADVLPESNRGSIAVIPQLLGKEPDEFIQVANRLYDWGYSEVNWNMGCPMRMVTAKHRGCGLLPHPDEVKTILDKVIPHLSPKLSVKVRLGLKDSNEIFQIVPILNDYPLSSVTVHPRLGRQQYNGVPDLDTFARVLPLLHAPVIYNGDIVTPDDAHRILARFPSVCNLMVGRGVLYRPTLPLEIKGQIISDDERIQQSKHFIRQLLSSIGQSIPSEEGQIRKIKEYWCLLWHSLPISEMQAREVLREKELTTVKKNITNLIQ